MLRTGADQTWSPIAMADLPLVTGEATSPAAVVDCTWVRATSGCDGEEPHAGMLTTSSMRTTVEPLEGNKVKLSVEVDEDEFEKALDAAFRKIAREVRIPGFRPGKAPRRILEARLGTDAARQEARREALPDYYGKALTEAEADAIAPP